MLAPPTWPESYELVPREATATETWVIASDIEAIGSDIVEGETGHKVDLTTYDGLLNCLAKINATPESYLQPCELKGGHCKARDQVDEIVTVYWLFVQRLDPSGVHPIYMPKGNLHGQRFNLF